MFDDFDTQIQADEITSWYDYEMFYGDIMREEEEYGLEGKQQSRHSVTVEIAGASPAQVAKAQPQIKGLYKNWEKHNPRHKRLYKNWDEKCGNSLK